MNKKISKENLDRLKQLESRVERLEKTVFGENFNKKKLVKTKTSFSGATGGVKLLISQGFFKNKKMFGEIRKALSKKGYYYSRQAVQEALDNLSGSRGPLVKIRERNKNYYAERK